MELKKRIQTVDYKRWLRNALIFFAPAGIVFFGILANDGTLDTALVALKLWALNTVVDLLRKFMATK